MGSIKTVIILFLFMATVANADMATDISQLQHQWAEVNYHLEGDKQIKAYENLIIDANRVTIQYPNLAEAWVWQGIIKSSFAGVKGGLGALSLAKEAKLDLEKAIELNGDVLAGSAYTSLGTLYSKVPGWPIAFGSDDKAVALLEQGLALNPLGIDSNYFYGSFLVEQKQYVKAERYLIAAQNASPRANRPIADKGRQIEIDDALQQLQSKLKK